MVPPATVRKLSLAALLLAAGFGLAGLLDPLVVAGVVGFAGGAVVASDAARSVQVTRSFVVAPLVVLAVLFAGLGFAGFGDVGRLVAVVGCAGVAGALVVAAIPASR